MKTTVPFLFKDGTITPFEVNLINHPHFAALNAGVDFFVYPAVQSITSPLVNGGGVSHEFELCGLAKPQGATTTSVVCYIEKGALNAPVRLRGE